MNLNRFKPLAIAVITGAALTMISACSTTPTQSAETTALIQSGSAVTLQYANPSKRDRSQPGTFVLNLIDGKPTNGESSFTLKPGKHCVLGGPFVPEGQLRSKQYTGIGLFGFESKPGKSYRLEVGAIDHESEPTHKLEDVPLLYGEPDPMFRVDQIVVRKEWLPSLIDQDDGSVVPIKQEDQPHCQEMVREYKRTIFGYALAGELFKTIVSVILMGLF